MLKVTYTKDGRQVTVEGITSIDKIEADTCEQANKTAKVDETTVKAERINPATVEFANVPTEGKALKISLSETKRAIQNFFPKKRGNPSEETMRQRVLEIEGMLDSFNDGEDEVILYYPEKDWTSMTEERMVTYCEEVGKRWANPIECCLEFVKKIAVDNGSDNVWAEVCQERDTMDWYRLYYDPKTGKIWYVGGSVRFDGAEPPSGVLIYDFYPLFDNLYGFPVVRL